MPTEGGLGPGYGLDVGKRNSVEDHEIIKVVKRGSRAGSRSGSKGSLTKSREFGDGEGRVRDRSVEVVSELGGSFVVEDKGGGINVDQNQIML